MTILEIGISFPTLSLSTYSSASMITMVGWLCVHSDDLQGIDQIVLCWERASFLGHGQPQLNRNVWPAFIWKMLMSLDLYGLHRINLWSFAPDLWRPWWI